MRIEFTVIGEPTAKGRPKFFRRGKFVGTYTPAKTRDAEYDFKLQSLNHRPEKPFSGPLSLTVIVYRGMPKSFKGGKVLAAEQGIMRPVTRPDTDNYLKLVQDAMNGIFWQDDSQIVTVSAEKYYSARPRITVRVAEMEGR